MYWSVVKFKYLQDYKLHLTFKNGKSGILDFSRYIKDRGVFRQFKDLEYFKKVSLNKELGVLCWPDGVDVAPETLYHEATGEPLPEWMIPEPQEKKKEKRRKAV
jgi:hypothetical protein